MSEKACGCTNSDCAGGDCSGGDCSGETTPSRNGGQGGNHGGCGSGCGGHHQEISPEQDRMNRTLRRVKHKIVVMSGKGGVGKSTVATNIAVGLSLAGKKVGLLDVDVHGPSIPRLLSLRDAKVHIDANHIEPVPWSENLSVMSLGFLLPNPYQPVIWRGPVKQGFIQQLLADVAWGDLDYMIVDCPPGTGDEPLSVLQMLGADAKAVIVTTPQGVAVDDVRRSVTFVGDVGNSVLGIVENMSGIVCSQCGHVENIFGKGGGMRLAQETGVRFLGEIPLDPEVVRSGDEGYCFLKVQTDSPTAKAIQKILKPILLLPDPQDPAQAAVAAPAGFAPAPAETGIVKVAVPLAKGQLTQHFGHCEQLAVVTANFDTKEILSSELVTPPPHEPSVMPAFVERLGVRLVIAGGMGQKAQTLFNEKNITVICGARSDNGTGIGPSEVVSRYMQGTLPAGANTCDH
ncbi:iron-sulfur cluster carrier protein MrpORP [Desulfovibrio psychrotolerans]|nr:iron-sulfur cluster carrier protein MrpORP [Desulfovibrio psychrotolerans]